MERWSSSLGFLLAAIGSAVGIGNIWRFSAVVGQNGGGAYLIPYLLAVFLFALPLMILEISMGRRFRGTVVSTFRAVRPQFRIMGWFICVIVLLVLSYYLVITGWTMGYILLTAAGKYESFSAFTGTYLPVFFFIVAALATGLVVSRGIRKGIERISFLMIPVCFIILIIMALYGFFLPGFSRGIEFFLTPDFSVLSNPLIWSAAFGQAFFSLSVGQGILLTYGAYTEKDQDIPVLSVIITIADLGVALLAGIVIFPIVFSYGLVPSTGAELAFSSLPFAFSRMPGGQFFALAFFTVLFFAALTSAVSMLEVSVAAVRESMGWTRAESAFLVIAGLILIGLPSALSYSAAGWTFYGVAVLDFMDETVGTIGLPVTAVITSVVFSWYLPQEVFEKSIGKKWNAGPVIRPLCRYIIPAVIIVTTGARLISGIDFGATRLVPGTPYIGTIPQIGWICVILLLLFVFIYSACRIRGCRLPGWLRYRRES